MTTATKKRPTSADAPAESPPIETTIPEPVMLTAALAMKALEKRSAIHKFNLPATAKLAGVPAMTVDVRIPDLGDPEIISNLPDTLLRRILTVANDVEVREGRAQPIDVSKPEEINFAVAKKRAQQDRAVVDATVVAGFVKPQVIAAEADRTSADQVLLEAIHPADRTAYFNWCNGQHMEAAATVEPFPDGSIEGVAVGGSGGVDGAATEPVAQAAGDGAA